MGGHERARGLVVEPLEDDDLAAGKLPAVERGKLQGHGAVRLLGGELEGGGYLAAVVLHRLAGVGEHQLALEAHRRARGEPLVLDLVRYGHAFGRHGLVGAALSVGRRRPDGGHPHGLALVGGVLVLGDRLVAVGGEQALERREPLAGKARRVHGDLHLDLAVRRFGRERELAGGRFLVHHEHVPVIADQGRFEGVGLPRGQALERHGVDHLHRLVEAAHRAARLGDPGLRADVYELDGLPLVGEVLVGCDELAAHVEPLEDDDLAAGQPV